MNKTLQRPGPSQEKIDEVRHGLIYGGQLRCAIAITTQTVATAKARHNLDPLATIALGRALSCAALMGSVIKKDLQYINLHLHGGGPLGNIVAEFIAPASLRGYVTHPQLSQVLPADAVIPQSVGEAVGVEGTITIKQGEAGKSEPYTGVARLVSGEIAQDVAQYFAESEQVPTIIAAGVKLDKDGDVLGAGGVLVQKIGGQEIDEGILTAFEEKFAHDFSLSQRIADGATPDEILGDIAGSEFNQMHVESRPIGFHCFCSRDRMAMTLIGLGESELRSIVNDVGKLEIKCHYCSEVNHFRLDELLRH